MILHAGSNSHRVLETFMAIAAAGCIVCPLNSRWSAREVQHALKLTGASILVSDPSFQSMQSAGLAANPNLQVLSITYVCSGYDGTSAESARQSTSVVNIATGANSNGSLHSVPQSPQGARTLEDLMQQHSGMHL